MRFLSGTAVLLSLTAPLLAQSTIVCSSNGNGRRVCPANTRNGVVLTHERSDGVCQQGSTWGYNPRGIYVSGGCSAEFQVGGSSGNDQGGNQDRDNGNGNQNGYGNNRNDNNGYGNNGNGNGNRNNGNQNQDQNGYGNNSNGNGYGNNGQRRGGVIPSGTRMDVRLEQTVSPSSAKVGDVIPGTLVNDVVADGRTIASSGTPVQARVTAVQDGRPGTLSLQLDSLSANGRDYKLSSNSVHSVRDSQTAQSGNEGGGGGALGALLGAVTNARQTGELPSGSVYTFRLTSPARTNGSGGSRDNQ